MKIYCAGAIKGDVKFRKYYQHIIDTTLSYGAEALTELNLRLQPGEQLSDKEIYERDISWLSGSKAVIAEVSGASLGVGFEISYALYALGIPVLALYNKEVRVSAMITGCSSPLLTTRAYADESEINSYIETFINQIRMR